VLGFYALGRSALGRTPDEGSYTLGAEAGSFVWTGQDADGYTLILTAEAGSFVWTGQDAGSVVNINFECDAGSFVWTGMDSDRAQTRAMLRAKGSSAPFLNFAPSGGGRINMRAGRTC